VHLQKKLNYNFYFFNICVNGLIATITAIIKYQYHSKANIPDHSFATINMNAAVLNLTKDMSNHSNFFTESVRVILPPLFISENICGYES